MDQNGKPPTGTTGLKNWTCFRTYRTEPFRLLFLSTVKEVWKPLAVGQNPGALVNIHFVASKALAEGGWLHPHKRTGFDQQPVDPSIFPNKH